MKTLGLIGGMSWISSAEYYRLANVLVRERLGGLHSAKILMDSADLAEIEILRLADRWDEIGARLTESALRLEAAGADVMVLCTNTMHYVAEPIEAALAVPFIHLADTTAAAVKAAGLTKVGLLGTLFTMEQSFYRDRVASQSIEVLVPGEEDRRVLSAIIYDELCFGVIGEESRAIYRKAIDRLVAEGAEGIILGCTEIPLLINQSHLEVPAFETTLLHVQAAVDLALAD